MERVRGSMKNDIRVMVLIIVVALIMMGFIGTTSGVSHASAGHAMGLDYSPVGALSLLTGAHGDYFGIDDLLVNNCLMALAASQENQASRFAFAPRARDVIDQNDNRNIVMDYIVRNPGSTQNDMVKALDMNIGTLRYHLMILALNHRVIPYSDGPRLVRYFVNKGTYSQDQMMVLSLLKRDPTSRLLGAISGKPAMTGSQISADSGLSYSDINRYLKELTAKGVVVKESVSTDRYRYRIAPEHEDYIAKNLRL